MLDFRVDIYVSAIFFKFTQISSGNFNQQLSKVLSLE